MPTLVISPSSDYPLYTHLLASKQDGILQIYIVSACHVVSEVFKVNKALLAFLDNFSTLITNAQSGLNLKFKCCCYTYVNSFRLNDES